MNKKKNPRISKNISKNNVQKKLNIIIIFVIVIILMFATVLIIWNISNKKNEKLIEQMQEKNIQEITVEVDGQKIKTIENDFSNMYKDVKAWIKIENTNINYPIVQGKNNEYYLKHNIAGEWNKAGWIFADYRNNLNNLDKNTIIYGHNMKNNTMFAEIELMLDEKWYEDKDNIIIFNTIEQKYIAEIISVYEIEASEFVVRNQFTENEFQQYISEIKNKSFVKFDTEVSNEDKILTLYTCDDSNKNRIIVQSKLISI